VICLRRRGADGHDQGLPEDARQVTESIDFSIRELGAGLRSGRLRAAAVMAEYLDRIAAREREVRAWAHIDPRRAMAAAVEADATREGARPFGPLYGVPIGVKDIIDTFDMPTEYGCRAFLGRQPTRDATIVARLRGAGAIIMGKTVTAEFAFRHAGLTRNPHDPARTPGGSSSGSAAAVAAGMVPAALGTQTKGSIIRPASFCGVVGYKPTLGLLPRTGILGHARLLDQPGVMARTVADAALLTEVMAGADHADEQSFGPRVPALAAATDTLTMPRLAFFRGPFWHRADAEVREAIEQLAQDLAIPAIDGPADFAEAEAAIDTIVADGIARAFREKPSHSESLLSQDLRDAIEVGKRVSPSELRRALELRRQLGEKVRAIVGSAEALLTLSAPGPAPEASLGTGDAIFATIWTLVGAPAISLPLLHSAEGLPLGVQLVGCPGGDAGLLRAAAGLEKTVLQPTFRSRIRVARAPASGVLGPADEAGG
jgi:Asp-tRNA(Asn)/Glu-tRNA(Gln) amidotransferase A subunit family amidase